MKITHYKKEMAEKLLSRQKTATTRYHLLPPMSWCVKGSRFKPVKFGRQKVLRAFQTTWRWVISNRWRQEGFESSAAMKQYLEKNDLIKNTIYDHVIHHEIKFFPMDEDMK